MTAPKPQGRRSAYLDRQRRVAERSGGFSALLRQRRLIPTPVDPATDNDRIFFERNPDRRHRVRLASPGECKHYRLAVGRPIAPGRVLLCAVRSVATGMRLRVFGAVTGAALGAGEEESFWVFESHAGPHVAVLEQKMRAAAEMRG